MKIDKKTIHLFLFLFIAGTLKLASQEIKLKIEAPEKVQIGQNFKIIYIIDSDKEIDEEFDINEIKGLDILYGPSFSKSTSIVTNKEGERETKYYTSYMYIVAANKSGKFTIPKFEIDFDGKKITSNSPTVQIIGPINDKKKESTAIDRQKQKIDKIIKNAKIDAFIKSIPSKNRINPSDTLSITYQLYTTSEDFKIVDLNLPSSRSFYSQSFRPNSEQNVQETIKGVKYYVFDIYKTIFQPKTTGSLTIDDGKIKLIYYIKTGEKMKNHFGQQYDVIGEKEMELKIDGTTVSVFELTEI